MNLTGTFSFCFFDLRIERIAFEQSDGTSILVIHKQILAVLFFRNNVEGTNSFIRLYFFFAARLFVANNVLCYFSLANGIFIMMAESNRFTFQIKFRRKQFIE